MKKHELDQAVKLYILDCIEGEPFDKFPETIQDKIELLKSVFAAESGHNVARVGQQNAVRDWLQGLPSVIGIEFANYEILKLAVKWGSIPENANEKQEENILNNYWQFMAAKVCQLMNGYHVPKGV